MLLPVVYQGSLSKMMQASLDDDLDNRPDHWMEFWNTCKTLPEALDQFAFQVFLSHIFSIFAINVCRTFSNNNNDCLHAASSFRSDICLDGTSHLQ